MPTLFAFARFLGLQGIVLLGALVFYEGLPAVNYFTPVVRFIPAIGPALDDLAQGRVGRAYQRGQLSERLIWQERQRRWEIATQGKVDAIEDAWNEERRRQAAAHMDAIAELERAIADEKTIRSGGGPSCNAALPRGVSRALDKVGR
jgi:hypothetical protein